MDIRQWFGPLLVSVALCACGGGGGSAPATEEPSPPVSTYRLNGQVQKGPFSIGSAVAVSELSSGLSPTGSVYNVQTSDDLGNFAVATDIRSSLVEILADGFYMNELTGRLSSSRIQLRAIVDLSADARPTVNLLTTLQAPRLRQLMSQGLTWTQASSQSRDELLVALGFNPSRVQGLSTLVGMKINGSADPDALLFAISTTLARMAANNAQANGTNEVAELSQLINTAAAQLGSSGSITMAGFRASFNLAASQVDLPTVRSTVEAYYSARGQPLTAPRFEEWMDKTGAGLVPQRLINVAGLAFNAASGLEPGQSATSNTVSVGGLGTGVLAPVSVSGAATIIRNGSDIAGAFTAVQDGDTLALRMVAPGLGLQGEATMTVGASRASWTVSGRPLRGSISGLQGTGLILGNGIDTAVIAADGSGFQFGGGVALSASYNVTVVQQPQSPPQICTVTGGSGTVTTTPVQLSIGCVTAAGFAFVTTQGGTGLSPAVTIYTAHPDTGALTVHSKTRFATAPLEFTVTPSGRFAYAANGGAAIQALSFDSQTGRLTTIGSFDAGGAADGLAIDPDSKFLYVRSSAGYKRMPIDSATGGLGSPIAVQAGALAGFVRITGTSAAVGSSSSPVGVQSYRVNPATGELGTPLLSDGCGTIPPTVTVNPDSRYVYAACGLAGIRVYSPDSTTGQLLAGATYAAGQRSLDGVLHVAGGLAFFRSRGENLSGFQGVASFAMNPTTGALSFLEQKSMQEVPPVLSLGAVDSVLHVIEVGQLVTYTITPVTGHLSRAYTAFPEPSPTAIQTLRR